MRGIRRTTGLALAVAGVAMLWTPGTASAQCHDLGVATNCTYVDGSCVQGGGRIGERGWYRFRTPTC